jgi:hypothetical protein
VRTYVYACLQCRAVRELEERELDIVRPGEFRLEHRCIDCGAWALVTVVGAYRDLTVTKCAALAVRA